MAQDRVNPVVLSLAASAKLPVSEGWLMWSPALLFNRRACGPEKLSPVTQKRVLNTIPPEADIHQDDGYASFLPTRSSPAHASALIKAVVSFKSSVSKPSLN